MKKHDELSQLAKNIEGHAFKRGCVSAFTLTAYPVEQDEELTFHITRECEGLVYGNAEVGSIETFKTCIEVLDGRVDYIVYDIALPFDISEFIRDGKSAPKKSVILPYSDMDVWIDSVEYVLLALVPDLLEKHVVVVGQKIEKDSLLANLAIDIGGSCRDLGVHTHGDDHSEANLEAIKDAYRKADVVVGAAVYQPVIEKSWLELCENNPIIVDAGIGTLTPDAAEYAREKGYKMIRVDNRAAMAGMLFSLIQTHDLITRVMGSGEIDSIPVVAGGVIGERGAVVVDSIDHPTVAIGFADGTGRIHYEPKNDEEAAIIERVRKAINREGANG